MENLEYYAINPKDQNNQFFSVHFILSEDKKTVTRKDNGWAVTFDSPLKIYTPRYCSWDGFEGWIDTLMRHDICLSREEAYIRLLEPKEDLKFIRKYHPDDLKEFCERVTPFNSFNVKRMTRVWFTLGYYKIPGINIHNLFYESEGLEKFRPKNKFQFNIWKKITNVIYGNNIPISQERITIAKNLNLANKGWERLLSFLLYGKEVETVVKLCQEYPSDVNKLLSVNPNLLSELSPKYWDGSFKITHLVKGGANLKSLTDVNVKLSKTELTRAFKLYGDRCIDYTTPWLDIPALANVKNIKLPHHWYHYIKDVVVLEWAHEKKAQLEKVQVIHGPQGRTMEMHNHQLLSHITPVMLTNGKKTAWRKVMQDLEEVQKKKIEDALRIYRKFPVNPIIDSVMKAFPQITRINNSFNLREEGNVMSHCVGGYINQCVSGKSIICHVKCGNNESTVELGKKEKKWEIFQHRGRNNLEPPYKNKTILIKFIEELNKGEKNENK